MTLTFYKYQGTGNDFIMIDNRDGHFTNRKKDFIARLCHRRFGIGADGLILLEQDPEADFKMVYFNADGGASSMCGNGGRCIVAFAKQLGIIKKETSFNAVDGLHRALIQGDQVSLEMQDVQKVDVFPQHLFLDTGSPHHIAFVEDVSKTAVKTEGRVIRYGEPYGEAGSNVNFVEVADDILKVRTYERGVEDETLSCGTGVTAAALAAVVKGYRTTAPVRVQTPGGELEISFQREATHSFSNIHLSGPATFVFKGELTI